MYQVYFYVENKWHNIYNINFNYIKTKYKVRHRQTFKNTKKEW